MSEEVQKTKRTVHRSPAYPSIDLERAIPLIQKLNEKFSDDVFSRDNAVEELGLQKGGDSFRKVAALVHFGLINRKGSSYNVTPLAKQILFPGDDQGTKIEAIENAARTPKLYKTLIISYQGKQLPTALYHRLITQEKFNQSVAEKVAKDFKKSIEFAGILKNGIVVDSGGDITIEDVKIEQPGLSSEETVESMVKQPRDQKAVLGGVPFPLGSEITVVLSEDLVRKIARGKFGDKFAKVLDDLEKLGKEEDEPSKNDASDTHMESN